MKKLAHTLVLVSLGLAGASASAAYTPISAIAQTGLGSSSDRDTQTISDFGDALSTTQTSFNSSNPTNQKNATATSQIQFAAAEIDMNLSLSFDAGLNAPDLIAQGEFIFSLPTPTSVTFNSTGFSHQSFGLQGPSASLPTMLDATGHTTLPAGQYDYFAFLDTPMLAGNSPIASSASLTIMLGTSGVGAAPPLPEPAILMFSAVSVIALRRRH
jgi:hypothetical protein